MFHDGKKDIIKYVFIAVVVLAVILIIVSQNKSEEGASETSSFEVETTENNSVEVVTSAVSEDKTEAAAESISEEAAEDDPSPVSDEEEYTFRNNKLLEEHYEKHGEDMGFDSAEDYEQAASDVVTNPEALHKTEKEDGDDVYYVEDTNEFVVVSTDGYIRTYFYPSSGKKYYDNQ